MLGDSTAAGLGAPTTDQLPGVLLARGLAEESGDPVRLVTHAVVGSKTIDMIEQVERALRERTDLALVIIGGNDVTSRSRAGTSAALLGMQVRRLIEGGVAVVVATCPDLGAIEADPPAAAGAGPRVGAGPGQGATP